MNVDVEFNETNTTFDVEFDETNSTPSTNDHSQLINRDKENQHPISAITGLEKVLSEKLDDTELPSVIDTALAEAKASGEFDGEDGKSPYIAENGNWMVWDAKSNKYVDTGISTLNDSGGMTEEERKQLSQNTKDIEDLQEQVGDNTLEIVGLNLRIGSDENDISENTEAILRLKIQIGDIDTALGGIIAIQNQYIGGES
jgi:hypothetical protein